MGQEHAIIARNMGLENIITVVNKMDTTVPPFSKDRHAIIKNQVMELLRTIGYEQSNIYVIPASSTSGDNLIADSENFSWLSEEIVAQQQLFSSNNGLNSVTTLINAIDAIEIKQKPINMPLRIVIYLVMDTKNDQKCHKNEAKVCGRIQYGILTQGMSIHIAPINKTSTIKFIKKNKKEVKHATAGDMVTLKISDILPKDVLPGHVISDTSNRPAKQCKSFTCRITITNQPFPIVEGLEVLVHCHAAYALCKIRKICKTIDVHTGDTIDDEPKSIKKEETAIVQMVPLKEKAICVEMCDEFLSLSRIIIRKSHELLGFGKITHVQYINSD